MENHKETGEKCPECAGSGEMDLHDIHPDELAGILSNPKCPTCKGTGQAPKQDDEAFLEAVRNYDGAKHPISDRYFWNAAIAHARKSDDRLPAGYECPMCHGFTKSDDKVRRLDDLDDGYVEACLTASKEYFTPDELLSVRDLTIWNAAYKAGRKSDESLREAVDILRYFYAFVPDSFHKERPLLITKVEAFLNEQEDK